MSSPARVAASRGNHVRAALWRARRESLDAGRRELSPMVDQLAALLELERAEAERLPALLGPLLDRAARGRLTQEARALFDLQALVVDARREEPLELVEWIRSFGALRYDRPRPLLRDLRRVRHLGRAIDRLRRMREDALIAILEPVHSRERDALTSKIVPPVVATLEEVGLGGEGRGPALEAIARHLVARIYKWGASDFGDLRDAIAANPAKMADLTAADLVRGDALVRADTRLAVELDGLHHRGELYLLALHRMQSLLFGTAAGRFASRFLLLPFGGAYVVLAFVHYVAEHLVHGVHLTSLLNVMLLGLVLGVVINAAPVRDRVVAALVAGYTRIFGAHAHDHGHEHDQTDAASEKPPSLIACGLRWVVEGWRGLVDRIDSGGYLIDEWIRYRGGERRGARVIEGLAELAWFAVSYVFRFAFKLMIEPTINPIKHFPVVTVAGKVSIASGLPILLAIQLARILPTALAGTLAFVIAIILVPGICGFVAWEVRFNWQLYRGASPERHSDSSRAVTGSSRSDPSSLHL